MDTLFARWLSAAKTSSTYRMLLYTPMPWQQAAKSLSHVTVEGAKGSAFLLGPCQAWGLHGDTAPSLADYKQQSVALHGGMD